MAGNFNTRDFKIRDLVRNQINHTFSRTLEAPNPPVLVPRLPKQASSKASGSTEIRLTNLP
ncbi:hypothetical protein L195_g045927 [Trifolium pratense]|uniref:Uncharacterized protein n=1 Tax=Trifolium pratense TaxID=57577 RepID=A0A2K3MG82_TRIPR|nr:hypothetical protein L195_g045927 [Trifolium pratense]